MEKNKEYYENLDKRTNEYKDWKKSQDLQPHTPKEDVIIEGVGDKVEKVFKAVGIDKLVKFVAGEDCGCDERKKKLNELFASHSLKAQCLSEDEYNYLDTFFKRNPSTVLPSEQKHLGEIYQRTFNLRYETSTCGSCVRTMVNRLEKLYKAYEN